MGKYRQIIQQLIYHCLRYFPEILTHGSVRLSSESRWSGYVPVYSTKILLLDYNLKFGLNWCYTYVGGGEKTLENWKRITLLWRRILMSPLITTII